MIRVVRGLAIVGAGLMAAAATMTLSSVRGDLALYGPLSASVRESAAEGDAAVYGPATSDAPGCGPAQVPMDNQPFTPWDERRTHPGIAPLLEDKTLISRAELASKSLDVLPVRAPAEIALRATTLRSAGGTHERSRSLVGLGVAWQSGHNQS